MIPEDVVEVRRSVCKNSCSLQCPEYLAGLIDHADPRASCPRKGWVLAWGCYGRCNGPALADPGIRAVRSVSNEPTLADLASNAAYAAWRAGAALAGGEKLILTAEEHGARASVCNACSLWDGSARFGLGKCNHPGCGCTRFKMWLTTEECPLLKWPTLEKQPLPPPAPAPQG